MSSSLNPGLGPDGTPNQSYQRRLEHHNTQQPISYAPHQSNHHNLHSAPTNSHTAAPPSTVPRNIGYTRPTQQQTYSPYYPSAPQQPQHQQQPQQQPPPNNLYQPYSPYQASSYQLPPQPQPQPHPQYQTAYNQPPPPHQQPQPSSYSYQQYNQNAYAAAPQYQQIPQRQHPSQNPSMHSYFQPSGRRRALLVGVNYRGTSAELRGCVRDVTFVHHLLTTKFGFKNNEFVVLTDEPDGISGVRRGVPTRTTILNSLNWLVSDSRPGDSLWFSFSGHGSQVRDLDGDEADGYDETILPVDYKKNGHIVDDELYAIVKRICRGARLTVLLDACHSGTGLDLPYQHDVFGTGSGQRIQGPGRPSLTQGLMGVAGAILNGNASGALSAGWSLATGRKKKQHTGPDPNAGEVLLFSGCKDNQTSADTSKLSGGLTTGAMTYALIETLEHSTVGDWRNYTYRKLLQTMRQKLRASRMTQTPQFSTSHPFDLDTPFVV